MEAHDTSSTPKNTEIGTSHKCDVLVVGGLNTDYIVRGNVLPRAGESHEGDTFVDRPGGKGVNQAVAASRLGARVVLVGAVGRDERGDRLLAHLRAERVDVRGVLRVRGQPTGAALVHVDRNGRKQSLAVPGANQLLTVSHVQAVCAATATARVVLAQLEVPLPSVVSALQWGRRAHACTMLDPAPAQALPESVLQLVNVIKPNAREARTLTGITVNDTRTARRAAAQLLAQGVDTVVIEAGEQGTLVVTGGHEQRLDRVPVRAVDTTGAGDTLAGVLAALIARDYPLSDAARLANAAAAWEITALGPQTPPLTEGALRQWRAAHQV